MERILSRISVELGPERFHRYFAGRARPALADGLLEIKVPTTFLADILGRRFGDAIRGAVRAEWNGPGGPGAAGSPVEVRFTVDPAAFDAGASVAAARVERATLCLATAGGPAPAFAADRPRKAGRVESLTLRHRLEDYVVADSNRLAYATALRLTEPGTPPPRDISPLFIHSGCGMGKTHLLQGVANRFRESHPGAAVRYITAEAFTNDFITAIRANQIDPFRRSYRRVDLLCIDDVHFLSSKDKTQAELLHTFDALDLGGSRVVMASDGHPRQIEHLSQALLSRFLSGMVVRVDPPEPALCEAIIRRHAERRGLVLEDAAIKLIASRCQEGHRGVQGAGGVGAINSIRELEGIINRIDALHRLLPDGDHGRAGAEGGRIGVLVATRALGLVGDHAPRSPGSRPPKPLKVDQIVAAVCRALNVDSSELYGRGRHKRVVLARAVTAHLSRTLTTMSYPEIAKAMGRPNHSTIITACQRLQVQIQRNEPIALGSDLDGLTIRELEDRLTQELKRNGAPPSAAPASAPLTASTMIPRPAFSAAV
jgi:chromosomal replication initiator protein